jgi:hypothetical protein
MQIQPLFLLQASTQSAQNEGVDWLNPVGEFQNRSFFGTCSSNLAHPSVDLAQIIRCGERILRKPWVKDSSSTKSGPIGAALID